MNDIWIAHDEPERPLAFGAWFCSCDSCTMAAKASVERGDNLSVVLKRNMGRDVISLDKYVELMGNVNINYPFQDYMESSEDTVREIFIADV